MIFNNHSRQLRSSTLMMSAIYQSTLEAVVFPMKDYLDRCLTTVLPRAFRIYAFVWNSPLAIVLCPHRQRSVKIYNILYMYKATTENDFLTDTAQYCDYQGLQCIANGWWFFFLQYITRNIKNFPPD